MIKDAVDNHTYHIISPLKGVVIYDDGYTPDEQMSDSELPEYKSEILSKIREYDEDIASYVDSDLEDLVTSIKVTVASTKSKKLVGYATVQTSRVPTEDEMNKIIDDLLGQYSDGWGEGFEQTPICDFDGSKMYLHFWNKDPNFRSNMRVIDYKKTEESCGSMKESGGLPPGYYTLGDGHIHKVPTQGYSKWYHRDEWKFRYNYESNRLECYYDNDKVDSIGLGFYNWIENPDYWVDDYLSELHDEAASFDLESEFGINPPSKDESVNESQTFMIAYREGGVDKYSSVTANDSSEALRIFNASVDKAGRHVNNAHVAVEDVDITEDSSGLPPMRIYNIVRRFDDEDIELATVEARNEKEAKANAIIALLDNGYYEDEVSGELEDGTIRVELKEDVITEDANKSLYEISFNYLYVEESNEPPYVRSAIFRRDVLVEADSSEKALEIFNNHYDEMSEYSEDGQISNVQISNVYPSLEEYKKEYPYSNKLLLNPVGKGARYVNEGISINVLKGFKYDEVSTVSLKCRDNISIYETLKKLPIGTRIINYDPNNISINPMHVSERYCSEKTPDDKWITINEDRSVTRQSSTLHQCKFFSSFDYSTMSWSVYVPTK